MSTEPQSVDQGNTATEINEDPAAVLNKHLAARPAEQDLKDRGILRSTAAAPALQATQADLERHQAADRVKRGLENRPEREELVERGSFFPLK